MAPSIKITYFNATAMAEPSRWLLKYANIDFEDERIEVDKWPELKPKISFGQLPILYANGKTYHQSIAMARYCAKQANLDGKDDLENLEIDGVVDTIADLKTKIAQWSSEKDETIKESRRGPLFNETLPHCLGFLDKIVKENSGYSACSKLTWADFYVVAMADFFNLKFFKCDILENYENLKKLRETIHNIPQIKKWIQERPKGMF